MIQPNGPFVDAPDYDALAARLAEEERKLKRITDAYAAYRARGALPAPTQYAELVAAIQDATPAI